jgi:hypothetical protein
LTKSSSQAVEWTFQLWCESVARKRVVCNLLRIRIPQVASQCVWFLKHLQIENSCLSFLFSPIKDFPSQLEFHLDQITRNDWIIILMHSSCIQLNQINQCSFSHSLSAFSYDICLYFVNNRNKQHFIRFFMVYEPNAH